MMDLPDVTAWLVVATIALAYAELQVQRKATRRYLTVATLWGILVALLIYLYTR